MSTELITPQPHAAPEESQAPTREERRAKILALEQALLADPSIQVHIEPKHHFAPGVYLREIAIPKGITLTGMIHKTEHICILSQGEVIVETDDGLKRIKASSVIKSQPGAKRVLTAIEDSVWINVHLNPDDAQDLDAIEARLVTDSFEKYFAFVDAQKQIQGGAV